MPNAIAQFLVSVIPESMGRFQRSSPLSAPPAPICPTITPSTTVRAAPLAATAQAYGFTDPQVGFAALMGQAFHLSPLPSSIC